jgi:hypothetical protein
VQSDWRERDGQIAKTHFAVGASTGPATIAGVLRTSHEVVIGAIQSVRNSITKSMLSDGKRRLLTA